MKEHFLQRQIEDALLIASKRPHFIGFLTETELAEAEDFLRYRGTVEVLFWGGYENARRKIAGFFPDYLEPSAEEFPLAPVTFLFPKAYTLAHRDFLGSFMALGIKRDVIGDILIEEGRCGAFVRTEILPYLQANLIKIGKIPVEIHEGFSGALPEADRFTDLSGVVASARVDCIAAFLIRQSREKTANLIKSGQISVNHREISAGTKLLKEGDVVSVRGSGRFIVDTLGPNTAKGRMRIHCRKYA